LTLDDLAQVREIATSLKIKYLVLAKCIEAKEQDELGIGVQSRLHVVLRIQMLDVETGEIISSRGFEGSQVTHTLVVGASQTPQEVYSRIMGQFAREYLKQLQPQ
jgi:hypothetical protein